MTHLNRLTKLMMGAAILSLSACATTTSSSDSMMTDMSKVTEIAPTSYSCWNGCRKVDVADCPPEPEQVVEMQCWDGSIVSDVSQCPAQQTVACWDGSLVTDASQCPAQPVTRSAMSVAELCGQEYRSETIYYEFDKGRSAETQAKINRILDVGQFCNVESITVVGHTDTSGAASYNMALSERRAKDARDELIRDGIDANRITSQGMGETDNVIDRGDGVKEQMNRRTEVLIKLSETGAMTPSN